MIQRLAPQRTAPDGRLDLPEVTLCAVTSVAIPATLAAMRNSLRLVRFGAAMLLTDADRDKISDAEIEVVGIDRLRSRSEYSRFMLKELHRHISTPFVLCVQWDGYVIDPTGWTDEFLDVDYIGAVWPHARGPCQVGNGGFSLRSRHLLRATADLRVEASIAEDIAICQLGRPMLEAEHGVRFAEPGLARRFSYERELTTGGEFGFHGLFNMPSLLGQSAMYDLCRELEPGLVGWIELRDTAKVAARRGQLRLLAWLAVRLPGAWLRHRRSRRQSKVAKQS